MMRSLIVSAFFAALSVSAQAAPAQIAITGGWIRAIPGGVPAGGYFVLRNNGDKPVTLTGAASPGCGMLMLHKSEDMSGMEQMTDVPKIDVPAHGTLTFAPGGYHLMCMEPRAQIKPGNTVPVTFAFADGTQATANFTVRGATGK